MGTVEGENKIDVSQEYEQISEDDYDISVTLTIGSDYFSCGHCGLVLDQYQLLEQAGIPDTFDAEGDVDDIDHGDEYGND